jgi:nucleoside-diphosphate-sugar epimerase
LVTGAAGFIGFHLATELLLQGWEVTGVDNFIRGEHSTEIDILQTQRNFNWITGDLCDPVTYNLIGHDFDLVFHLAALNGTQNFYESPFQVLEAASIPTILLLKHFQGNSCLKRFIFSSTSETYAGAVSRFQYPVPTDEQVPLVIDDITNPRWSYAAGKIASESAVIAAGLELSIPWTILRYHNVYGPRMGDKHVIPDFLRRLQEGIYELYGADDTRSFMYVDDAVRASIDVALSPVSVKEIVNIGEELEIKIIDLALEILKIQGIDHEITVFPSPAGSVNRRSPDITKLKHLIMFVPRYTLEDGLKKTLDWYLN